MLKEEKKEKLIALRTKMSQADLPLKEGATQLVFGQGNPDARVMFIGEGPGYWEDQKGIPFVGNAGALLNKALEMINLNRKSVFITNVVHYRPPQNRDPHPEELEAFGEYLDQIIDIIAPDAIVTLGRFSMAKFIPDVFISSVHGKRRVIRWKDRDITVLPMYHPAAALRNGAIKTAFLEDFQKISQILGKEEVKTEVEPEQEDKGQIDFTKTLV